MILPPAPAFTLLAGGIRSAPVDQGQLVVWLLGAAMAITGICTALLAASRAAHRRRTNSHAGLFAGLCGYHNLDRKARSLLRSVARAHRLSAPAKVFLDPTLFDTQRLPSTLRGRQAELRQLRQRLFSTSDGKSPRKAG